MLCVTMLLVVHLQAVAMEIRALKGCRVHVPQTRHAALTSVSASFKKLRIPVLTALMEWLDPAIRCTHSMGWAPVQRHLWWRSHRLNFNFPEQGLQVGVAPIRRTGQFQTPQRCCQALASGWDQTAHRIQVSMYFVPGTLMLPIAPLPLLGAERILPRSTATRILQQSLVGFGCLLEHNEIHHDAL